MIEFKLRPCKDRKCNHSPLGDAHHILAKFLLEEIQTIYHFEFDL